MSLIVDPHGRTPNDVLLVGEAPGREEAARGRPFVGKSGQEQAAYLARHGISAYTFRMANVVPEYIDGNPDPTPELVRKWTPYLLEEVERTKPKLIVAVGRFAMRWFLGDKAQLDACHGIPHTAGAFDATRKNRGGRGNAVVVPIHHPAAGFYNPDIRALIDWDYARVADVYKLLKAGKTLQAHEDEWKGRERYRDVSGAELAGILEVEQGSLGDWDGKYIALDTEGSPSQPWSLQVSITPGEAYVLRRSQFDFDVGAEYLQSLANAGVTFITHDANTPMGCLYDVQMCRAMGIELRRAKLWNTMYAAYLLRLEPKGLKALAYRWAGMEMDSYGGTVENAGREKQIDYLCDVLADKWPKPEPRAKKSNDGTARLYTPQGVDKRAAAILVCANDEDVNIYKRWRQVDRELREPVEQKLGRMPYSGLDDVPLDVAVRYAARDADATLRVYTALKEELARRDLTVLMERGMEVLPVLEEMQATGIPASRDMFENLRDDMANGMDVLQNKISKMFYGGKPFNPKSTKQMSALLRRRGLEPAKRTKTGAMSTGKQSIEHLRYRDPAVALCIEWREKQHTKDMFAEKMLVEMDDRYDVQLVHTNVNPLGTTTRRLATNDPNLLAFPKHEKPGFIVHPDGTMEKTEKGEDYGKRVRSCFICPPGQIFLECDLSQIELRMFAHESNDAVMVSLFNEGKLDFHTATAAKLFGVPYDQVTKGQRTFAKRVNFGIPYGVSGMGMATQLRVMGIDGWDDRTCEKHIQGWHRIHTGASKYMDDVENEVAKTGYVRDCWGMYRYLPGVWSTEPAVAAEARRHAVNHRIQGGAQGLIQNAMAWLRRELWAWQDSGIEVYWQLQVHDALMFRVDEEYASALESLVLEAMTEHCGMTLRVPVLADSKMARTWGEL